MTLRTERRASLRPPLWLNLVILNLAVATFGYSWYQRTQIDRRTAGLLQRSESNPANLNRLRDELAAMSLSKEELTKKLDSRLDYERSIETPRFYISIDTKNQKFYLRFGGDVAREAGALTNVQLRGEFTVTGKSEDTGHHVIVLTNHYVIESDNPRPGSIVVPDADLAAIWPRITTGTKVYIF